MNRSPHSSRKYTRLRYTTCLAIGFALLSCVFNAQAQQPNLTVIGVAEDRTETSIFSYRWLIEEDVTHHIVPGQSCQNNSADCLSLNFHKSYLPVVAEGDDTTELPDLDSNKRYFISVIPAHGDEGSYTIGGAPIAAGQTDVTVYLNEQNIPTAQIRIFVFHDNEPINGAPDTPAEVGLGGFSILLEDAGGRYGASGQQIVTDAFGNPLGTTYSANGDVTSLGDGTITTNASGMALIKNLVPGKYGIQVVPPLVDGSGQPTSWSQTSTIEGSNVIDAWVKAGEPPYFAEFGPPGPHVFVGFIDDFNDSENLSGGVTLSGQIRNIHNSRPPDFAFHTGAPTPGCWVGLNNEADQAVHASPCYGDSQFSIDGVPDGSYTLSIWDDNLGVVFGLHSIVIEDGQCNDNSCNLLDVPVFNWFGRVEQYVFNDANENGFWDEGEAPLPESPTALRWRDGTVYQEFPTDFGGAAPYDEVFPFFSWLVAEVGFDRFKATGVTIYADDGGPIDPDDDDSFGGVLNPQPQSENGDANYRTETGPVLTQGVQQFLGQTNVLQWGKKPYVQGENGGISGMVHYAVTRAEDDPRFAGAEVWEPGIPNIQVALYEDVDNDGTIDDLNGDGCVTLADVDNYPFDNFPGPEDFDYPPFVAGTCEPDLNAGGNGVNDMGDAIQVTYTDSWDAALPIDCQGENDPQNAGLGVDPDHCFDGLRNFNQVRPAVFDGGYAFDGLEGYRHYIVGTGEHPVYKTVQEEDKNVDFGDNYNPDPLLLPPICVGDPRIVPVEYSLFPLADGAPLGAGTERPGCDRKHVLLNDGQNAAANFFLFTHVPVAAKMTGFVLDDTANEFDLASPTFGEKYSPPYLPISIRDFTGREIHRTYTDKNGSFNAVAPSTYTANVASSSGMSPNMLTTCMNDPGPLSNGQIDPNYNPRYSQFCYNFQYMPGVTTYLDTPVVPVAAFAGPGQEELQCMESDGVPVIAKVTGSATGPYVNAAGDSITITALPGHGFGSSAGTVAIGGVAMTDLSWSDDSINGTVAAGTETGQLVITTSEGVTNEVGITVTVGGGYLPVSVDGSIQDAIDSADPGDLILIGPGEYEELIIMHKPVRLQGVGADTIISAIKSPQEKLDQWRDKLFSLLLSGDFTPLPGQREAEFDSEDGIEFMFTEEGAGILVLGNQGNGRRNPELFRNTGSRIDGLSVTGSDHAGGIVVNGYADNLVISNNRVFGNHGIYGGGIRVGHPTLTTETNSGPEYTDGQNDGIVIHHNAVLYNGGEFGAGGGISLYHGSDGYQVTDNRVCGNFNRSNGGGIAHYGFSDSMGNDNNAVDTLIARNKILYNQSFYQGAPAHGGGLYIAGAPGLEEELTPGTGNVTIAENLIQGNQAGAGNGGGIAALRVHGELQGNPNRWPLLSIENNMIVNNMAGYTGAGISLQDVAKSEILHNTIAHNDSTATAGAAFTNNANQSDPQPAGIVSFAHSEGLQNEIPRNHNLEFGVYAKPVLDNNIVYRNRSFFFYISTTDPTDFGLDEALDPYADFGVLGAVGQLNPTNSVLTNAAGYDSNNLDASDIEPDGLFVSAYVNSALGGTIVQDELKTSIAAQPAFDEGGNFIDARFGPLHEAAGDYHLKAEAVAIDQAGDSEVSIDIDGDARPGEAASDIGADEFQ